MRAPDLALYHYDSCPFCFRVRRALSRLGVEVELRNIHQSEAHRQALIAARGAQTVPVLRIQRDGQPDEWMPESADIVRYLEKRFGA